MKNFIKINKKTIIFTLSGGLIGFLYVLLIGCKTNCFIASNKYISTIVFAIIGFILSLDTKNKKEEKI